MRLCLGLHHILHSTMSFHLGGKGTEHDAFIFKSMLCSWNPKKDPVDHISFIEPSPHVVALWWAMILQKNRPLSLHTLIFCNIQLLAGKGIPCMVLNWSISLLIGSSTIPVKKPVD